MYDLIERQALASAKLYTESLIGRGDISVEDAEVGHGPTTGTGRAASSGRSARPLLAGQRDESYGDRVPT